jgi:trimeric autotransporter adhesin
VFTPAANANGTGYASFTFQVQDNGGTANSGVDLDQSANTMTLNVTAVNDAPAGTDNTVTVNEDASYTFTAANFGFSDASDAPANNFSAVKITTIPGAGSLTLNGVAVTAGQSITKADIDAGKLKFAPAANANGAGYASFTFQVQDNGGTANSGVDLDQSANTMTIDVTSINDAPSGTDNTVTANENFAYTFTAADFGFSDASDAPANNFSAVKIATIPGAGSLTNNGVAVVAGDVVTKADIDAGKLVFTPAANVNGAGYASFTFQVQDDGGIANSGVDLDQSANTLTIDVIPVNAAPSGTSNTVTTNEDIAYTFTAADFGFSDAQGNSFLAVKITTLPGAGTLTNNGVAVNTGDFVTKADIDAGLLKFAPAANANGTGYASFTFQVQDDGGTSNGGIDLDQTPNTMTVNVTTVNDAPSGTGNTVTTNEDTAYTFTAADFGFSDTGDSPANGFQAVVITTLPTVGTLTWKGATFAAGNYIWHTDIDAGFLKFTPAANANGAGYASFTFQVQDDGGTANGGVNTDQTPKTMTVNVTPVNDAPAGTSNTVSTNQDIAYTFTAQNFGFSDASDAPANNFSAVQITAIPGAGTLTNNGVAVNTSDFVAKADIDAGKLIFTPASKASGTGYANFAFRVKDDGGTANGGVDTGSTRTMTINVVAAPITGDTGTSVVVTPPAESSTPSQTSTKPAPQPTASSGSDSTLDTASSHSSASTASSNASATQGKKSGEVYAADMPIPAVMENVGFAPNAVSFHANLAPGTRISIQSVEEGGAHPAADRPSVINLNQLELLRSNIHVSSAPISVSSDDDGQNSSESVSTESGAKESIAVSTAQAREVAGALASLVTLGLIARKGALAASLLASLPAWGRLDPLPVLGNGDDAEGDASQDTPQDIADHMFSESKAVPEQAPGEEKE